jgi:cation:H+ antiporter
MINAWTNHLTGLCLVIALPTLIWGLRLSAKSRSKKALQESQSQRISLSLSLVAMVLFNLTLWTLGHDKEISRFDGFWLIGLFLSWQCFRYYELLKEVKQQSRDWHPMLVIDIALILTGSIVALLSTDGIVSGILAEKESILRADRLGLLTGVFMLLPSAGIALYYGWKQDSALIYRTQLSGGQISMPLSIGLFAIFKPITVLNFIEDGLLFITTVALVHLICVLLLSELPKLVAAGLVAAYSYALYLQFTL